jgi:SOS-response transcriptional repressor LexA
MSTKKDYTCNFSAILERLHTISGKENEYEVAEMLGFKKDTFAARKSRGSVPEKEIKLACVSNGWNFDWVMYGKGEMLIIEAKPRGGDASKEKAEDYVASGGVDVGVYALAGAGNPTDLVNIDPVEKIVIPQGFYRPSIITIKVRGKSMEPLIRDGAYVGVDREDKWIVSGEIYAVWLPHEGAVIKRLYLDMEKITLKSDNPQFPVINISLQGLDDNFIQGRVKWVIQML